MTTFANTESQIEALYVGYFGRAGDPAGVQYWLSQAAAGMSIAAIAASFSVQTEATNLYPFLKNPLVDDANHDNAAAFINSVFEDLFNRAENSVIDPTGFAYWLGRVVAAASNPQAMGQIIEDIISGATGVDSTTLANKVTVADDFTNSLAATTQPFVGNAIAISQSTVTNTTSDPTTVTTEETVISNFINNVAPLPGVYSDLTPGIDHVVISTINTIDHVEGIVDTATGSTDSTYTIGDSVHGNGLTNLDLAVDGSHSASAALATLVGVSNVNILMGQYDDVTFNASLWKNVNNVSVSGLGDDTYVTVDHLNVSNGDGIKLSINSTDYGYLSATGKVSGLSYSATVQSENGIGTVASFGTAGVDIVVGKSGTATVDLYQYADKTGANASVGNISIGHVNVNVGVSADATVEIYNEAYVHGTGVHNATAGNITVGAVNYTVAASGYGKLEVYNEAYAEATGGGNAAVGNTTVGNIAGHLAKGAEIAVYLESEVTAEYAGNGTVGNLTVGNISMTGGSEQYVEVYNYVNDDVKGNATVGNITIGNISLVGASGDQSFTIEYNGADALKGNATAGNVNIGNVAMAGSGYLKFEIDDQGAYAKETGNATSGSVTIGTVSMDAKAQAEAYFYVDNYAVAATSVSYKGGVATVGSVTIGNVTTTGSYAATMDVYNYAENRGNVAHNATAGNISIGNITGTQIVGTTGHGLAITAASNKIRIENYASAEHGNASVGNVSIGNIGVNANAPSIQAAAVVTVDISNEAVAYNGMATAGTITVGNVTLNVGLAGSAHLFVENYAQGITSADSTGKVTVGNVSLQGGSGAKMGVTVENYAYSTTFSHFIGSTGGISIGNVAMALTKPLGDATLFVSETGNQAGQVTVGNVTLSGHTGSLLNVTVYEEAGKGGHATGLTIGNVSLTGAKATANLSVSETGGSTGLLKVGNVTLSAGKVHMSITNDATGGNAGGVQVGNVTLKGNGVGTNFISQTATGANAGTLSVGTVSMTVGKGQDLKFSIGNVGANHVGTITVGNVALAIANTKAGAANHVTLDIHSTSTGAVTGGNIQVGNIAISAGGESKSFAAANMSVHVTVDSADGTVSVGNISVSGGVLNTAGPTVLDNFAHFSNGADALATWFGSTGTSHTTVGNIDYSTYVGSGAYSNGVVDGIAAKAGGTLIDVDTLKGAGVINGATAGTAIVDNSGTNAINVSFSTKADTILLQDSQTAVVDSSVSAFEATVQSAVDSIIGVHTGDVIGFAAGNFATGFGLTGTTPLTQGGASTYANFLATAETAIDTNGFAFYSADVGGNTYVAMNHAGHVAEVVEVTGIHTFTLSADNYLVFAS